GSGHSLNRCTCDRGTPSDSTADRCAALITNTRSADRASSAVSDRERWLPRSKPSPATTRCEPSLAGCPGVAAVPADNNSTWSASGPSAAVSVTTASGLRQVFPVHTNRIRNAGGWADMPDEDRCALSRASTALAREVLELAEPGRDVERTAAK